ncbi:MAG: VOC family protein [Desulfosarcina sp.]
MRHILKGMLVLAGAALLMIDGCTATTPRWPAISESPTDVHLQGRWVWTELLADNVDIEKAFYREVFGWQFETYGTGKDAYTFIHVDGRPIAGIVPYAKPADVDRSARWLAFMSVPDVDRAADQAAASGGKVLVPSKNLAGRGTVAVLQDREGAIFGVIHATAGDPPDVLPPTNTWLWIELWAKDSSLMADFYRPIGAYAIERQEDIGDRPEIRLMAGGYPRAAVLELERKDLPSTWLPYIRVGDLRQTLARIERAGGSLVVPPSPTVRNGQVAVFLDPLGAALAIAQWTDENDAEDKP